MPTLVQAESEQWLIDTVFSSIVLLSFLVSYLLSFSRMDFVVPYVDPVMVILASVYFVRIPLARFIHSLHELLMMAPAIDVQKRLNQRIDGIAKAHGFNEARVRSAKIGRELSVDVAFIAPADFGNVAIEQLDRIRTEVKESLSELGYQLWVNILFTNDRQWS